MNLLWGTLMAAVVLFMLVDETVESDFVVYRLLVARLRILWGEASACLGKRISNYETSYSKQKKGFAR